MENNSPRVKRSAWRTLRQDDLPVYADNVLTKTAKPEYDPVRDSLTALTTVNVTLKQSLANALTRDRAAVAYKDIVLKQFFACMEKVASDLEYHANGSEMYIINAGMEVHKSRSNHTAELVPSANLVVESTGIPGQALLKFHYPKSLRKQVETFAVEHSHDVKATWQNGVYRNSMRILVDGLPSRQEVFFRVRALGTRGRKSPWTFTDNGVFVV